MKTIEYIKQAIISEIEGYEFYKIAAKNARDAFVKETYLKLAEEEREHVEWLQELGKSLEVENYELDLMSVQAPPSPGLFKWENLDREDPSTTLSVFGIALQLEKSSMEFYTKAADDVEDEKIKELFLVLAAWEKGHYLMFDEEYKKLMNDWWDEQRFSPF